MYLSLDLFHYLIKKLCPWHAFTNFDDTKIHVNTILPLRLVDKQWKHAVDTCSYYWRLILFTTYTLSSKPIPHKAEHILPILKEKKESSDRVRKLVEKMKL